MKLSDIASDTNKEEHGVWVPYQGSEFELKIARIKNPAAEKRSRKRFKKARGNGRRGGGDAIQDMTEWERLQLLAPVVAAEVVKDWRGLVDANDEPIPFSEKKCLEILNDVRYRNLFEFIIEVSNDQEEYRAEEMEDAVGNSEAASSGS